MPLAARVALKTRQRPEGGGAIPLHVQLHVVQSGLASSQFLMCSTLHFKRLLICEDSTTQTASDAERQAFEVFLFCF